MSEDLTPTVGRQRKVGIVVLVLSVLGSAVALYFIALSDHAPANIPIPVASAVPVRHQALRSAIVEQPGGYVVRTHAVILRVPATLRSEADLRVVLDRYELLTPSDRLMIMAGRRIAHDPNLATYVKANPDEVQKLRQINLPDLTLTAGQRQQLASLWTAYVGAANNAKPQAEKDLVQALSDIASDVLPTAKRELSRAAEQTRDLVTVKQLAELEALDDRARRPQPTAATTQPIPRT